jgi:hypothetical protein
MSNIKSGNGCEECYHEGMSITYTEAENVAEAKGYRLEMTLVQFEKVLQKAREHGIKPSRCKLKWSCGKHTWYTSYDTMKGTGRCPHCDEGYYEARTRWIFKRLLGEDFVKTQVNDLIPRSYGFHELSRRVKIAFEFNGYQHYEFPNIFHETYTAYINQRNNDANKVEACADNNIILVVIPYTLYHISNPATSIANHIISEVTRQGRIILNDPSFNFHPGRYSSFDDTLDNFLGNR